jgi:cellulose synthase/poly-beta-1,6-N-acetylglucosamine synthase-like glycosyltransferase
MPQLLAYLRENGYRVVPVQELLTPPTQVALASTLSFGDTDEHTQGAVSKLQWFLYTERYLDPYALTGIFDEQTRAALVNFQSDRGLIDPRNPNPERAGIADAATREAVARVSSGGEVPGGAPPQTMLAAAGAMFGGSVRAAYIHVFPAVRNTLMVVTLLALFLVGVRMLGLIILIFLRRYLPEPPPLPRRGRSMPGISILIPAYNEQENIAATVESIASSIYPKREIIVIDDGSTDRTSKEVQGAIRRCAGEDIQLLQIENGGKARALNTGLFHAKHEIIVVLDADAVLDRKALYYFARHFADPSVGAVAGKVCTTRHAGLLDMFQTLEYAVGQNIDKTAFSGVGAVGIVPGPAGAWRRAALDEAGGFSTETLVEDQDMTLTLLRQGKRVVYEPRVIAYTETPSTLRDFLKQRFRWVYGTMQCFWKHKSALREKPFSVMSLIVLPNVFVYNIFLPFTYPFADSALVFGIAFGEWKTLVLPFIIFTLFDLSYALYGIWREEDRLKLMLAVPLQRIVYRQLLYVTVIRGIVRAVEGSGSTWNKFTKMGETRRFYFSNISGPDDADLLPDIPEPLALAGGASFGGELVAEPALVPNVLQSVFSPEENFTPPSTGANQII